MTDPLTKIHPRMSCWITPADELTSFSGNQTQLVTPSYGRRFRLPTRIACWKLDPWRQPWLPDYAGEQLWGLLAAPVDTGIATAWGPVLEHLLSEPRRELP